MTVGAECVSWMENALSVKKYMSLNLVRIFYWATLSISPAWQVSGFWRGRNNRSAWMAYCEGEWSPERDEVPIITTITRR